MNYYKIVQNPHKISITSPSSPMEILIFPRPRLVAFRSCFVSSIPSRTPPATSRASLVSCFASSTMASLELWLVRQGKNPSETYESVNWDDDTPSIWENIIDVPNHQPELVFNRFMGVISGYLTYGIILILIISYLNMIFGIG